MKKSDVSPRSVGSTAEVERWESAFETYANTTQADYGSDFTRRALATAEVSRQVAQAWRDIADHADSSPQWLLVALHTAAEAYEDLGMVFAEHVHPTRTPPSHES